MALPSNKLTSRCAASHSIHQFPHPLPLRSADDIQATGTSNDGGLSGVVDRSARARAMQLASVCLSVHHATGGQGHTPPQPDNAMLVILKGILAAAPGTGGGGVAAQVGPDVRGSLGQYMAGSRVAGSDGGEVGT